jgi:choline transport protein
MGDFDSTLGSATGVPAYQIFIDSFGRTGATVAFLVNILLLAFAVIGIICASSRAVWSMARDGGFPGSKLYVLFFLPLLRVY